MPHLTKFVLGLILMLLSAGCATTYVPVSWDIGDKVQQLSRSDLLLATLFERYDPDRTTLRVSATSFDEVMMPEEVQSHLGAYRPDTRLIYRNMYRTYTDQELGSLLQHEFAHHVWYHFMNKAQRMDWKEHLTRYPTTIQFMVRSVYGGRPDADFDGEDFAFMLQSPRTVDIEELAELKVITPEERDAILKQKFPKPVPAKVGKVEPNGGGVAR